VYREVGGDFRKPFHVAGGREVGKGVREELQFHGDAVEELCFILVDLCEDYVLMLECVFHC
jgi:hypothetical protein